MSEIRIPYEIFSDPGKLPHDEQLLLEQALKACEGSWSPYSGFAVGCALLLEDGEIICGNNQENRAYPSGICAERTALYYAGSLGKGKTIRKIAIRAKSKKTRIETPVTPCGACRQVMAEYEKLSGSPFEILMQGEFGSVLKVKGVEGGLLPFSFNLDF